MFSGLLGVRLLSSILSRLNILCISAVKQYCTVITIRSLFTVHVSPPITCSLNYQISLKPECFIYLNVYYFIRTKVYVLKFLKVSYSLHKCGETVLTIAMHLSPFTCFRSSYEQKTCHQVVRTSIWLISHSD